MKNLDESIPVPVKRKDVNTFQNNQIKFTGGASAIPLENMKCNIFKAKMEEDFKKGVPVVFTMLAWLAFHPGFSFSVRYRSTLFFSFFSNFQSLQTLQCMFQTLSAHTFLSVSPTVRCRSTGRFRNMATFFCTFILMCSHIYDSPYTLLSISFSGELTTLLCVSEIMGSLSSVTLLLLDVELHCFPSSFLLFRAHKPCC